MIKFNQEKTFITFEELKEKIIEIIEEEDINPTFLTLLFVMNYRLINQLTKEEFYEKFCKIVSLIKNSKELNEIFNSESTN